MGTNCSLPPYVTGSWLSSMSVSRVDFRFSSATNIICQDICKLQGNKLDKVRKIMIFLLILCIILVLKAFSVHLLVLPTFIIIKMFQKKSMSIHLHIWRIFPFFFFFPCNYLFFGIVVDKWVDNLPCSHEYIRRVNYKYLAKPLWVAILSK